MRLNKGKTRVWLASEFFFLGGLPGAAEATPPGGAASGFKRRREVPAHQGDLLRRSGGFPDPAAPGTTIPAHRGDPLRGGGGFPDPAAPGTEQREGAGAEAGAGSAAPPEFCVEFCHAADLPEDMDLWLRVQSELGGAILPISLQTSTFGWGSSQSLEGVILRTSLRRVAFGARFN